MSDVEERERYRKKLDELWLCVIGNGHPEEGMKWKVEKMSKFTQKVEGVFWAGVLGACSAFALLVWKIIVFLVTNKAL